MNQDLIVNDKKLIIPEKKFIFDSASKICIFGMSGSGKSTLCRTLQNYFPNVFVFDTLNEYKEEEFRGNVFYNFHDFSEFVKRTQHENGIRALFKFSIEEANSDGIFDECVRLLYYRGNCTIVVEEVQNFASAHSIPPFFKQIALTGRHQKISYITTTQRIAECHKTILTQAQHRFAGFCDNPIDSRTLREWGIPEQMTSELELYQFIWKDGKIIHKVDNHLKFL